jgi:DNA helicase HerA-like ATPase
VLRWIYKEVGALYAANAAQFPDTGNGPYFSKGAQSLLRILVGDGISGTSYLQPFAIYHDLQGTDIFTDIVQHLEAGISVFVDYSNAPEEVAQNLSERIANRVFARMVDLFSTGTLGERYIIMYFEEAHRLFRADDKDLSSVYNRLAKEGAKFHIGMVYATQSMTTMSPDLLKNTENFIIAHLNDDREVREVTRRYEFRDVAEDVQRIRSRGFVRMITLSHRFALPVQLRKFEAQAGRP